MNLLEALMHGLVFQRINIRWNFQACKADDSPWTVVSAQEHVSEGGVQVLEVRLASPERLIQRTRGFHLNPQSVHIADQQEISI